MLVRLFMDSGVCIQGNEVVLPDYDVWISWLHISVVCKHSVCGWVIRQLSGEILITCGSWISG